MYFEYPWNDLLQFDANIQGDYVQRTILEKILATVKICKNIENTSINIHFGLVSNLETK